MGQERYQEERILPCVFRSPEAGMVRGVRTECISVHLSRVKTPAL